MILYIEKAIKILIILSIPKFLSTIGSLCLFVTQSLHNHVGVKSQLFVIEYLLLKNYSIHL